jgi:D-aspartate ligase
MADQSPRLDTSVPALLVRVGRYPLHAGSLGVVRSLGVLGVPVYAVVADRLSPVACSRRAAGRFVWPHSGGADPADLIGRLLRIGRRLGRPTVAIATDDEAALLLAEPAAELAEYFLLPRVPPSCAPSTASPPRGRPFSTRLDSWPRWRPRSRFPWW